MRKSESRAAHNFTWKATTRAIFEKCRIKDAAFFGFAANFVKVLKYSVKEQKRRAFCSREESNLHGLPHTVLSRTRLPFRHVSVALSGL